MAESTEKVRVLIQADVELRFRQIVEMPLKTYEQLRASDDDEEIASWLNMRDPINEEPDVYGFSRVDADDKLID